MKTILFSMLLTILTLGTVEARQFLLCDEKSSEAPNKSIIVVQAWFDEGTVSEDEAVHGAMEIYSFDIFPTDGESGSLIFSEAEFYKNTVTLISHKHTSLNVRLFFPKSVVGKAMDEVFATLRYIHDELGQEDAHNLTCKSVVLN